MRGYTYFVAASNNTLASPSDLSDEPVSAKAILLHSLQHHPCVIPQPLRGTPKCKAMLSHAASQLPASPPRHSSTYQNTYLNAALYCVIIASTIMFWSLLKAPQKHSLIQGYVASQTASRISGW